MDSVDLHIRPNYIDYAKVIGMFLVIFAHYRYYSGLDITPSPLLSSVHCIQLFHMPLFFIISGLLYKGISTHKEELSKIWRTLCVPYILICGITTIIYFVYLRFAGGFSWHKLYYAILGIITGFDSPSKNVASICKPMWFVYALALIRLTNIFVQKHRYLVFFVAATGLIVMHLGNCLPFRMDSGLVGFVFFSIGYYGKKFLVNTLSAITWWELLCISICSAIVLILVGYYNDDFSSTKAFSINAMYYGKYPVIFIFSGVAGTLLVLILGIMCGRIHTYIHTMHRVSTIQTLSTGLIVTLGFHKLVYTLLFAIHLPLSQTIHCASSYALATYVITYLIIVLLQKNFPIAIGRK